KRFTPDFIIQFQLTLRHSIHILKYSVLFLSYLYIYIGNLNNAIAQKTYLTIKTEKELSRSFEDYLGLPVFIEHEKTPAKEAESIHQKLLLTGYIDSELLKITRQADTLYTAHFNLGRQFKEIIIEYNHQDFSKEDIKSIFLTSSEGQIRIPIKDLPRVIEDLTKIQSNKGRPFSKIKLNHIK